MDSKQWVLILGGSGGFGWATAQKMARHGYNLFLVHRERKSVVRQFEKYINQLENETKVQIVTCNETALTIEGQEAIVDRLNENAGSGTIILVLHAIAAGNVRPIWEKRGDHLSQQDFAQTIHAMGYSLLEWVQLLLSHKLLSDGARVIGLSSEGAFRAGENYAAVGAAKAVLESLCYYMARELAPYGIRSNLINAGVTDTKALRGIPGHDKMLEWARAKNPMGRITDPSDVANVVYLLCQPEADWINGAVIRVDGGEQIVGW